MPSSDTWLTLNDRPPPTSVDEPGKRCLCWFQSDLKTKPELGFYLGNGQVRLLSAPKWGQRSLELERVTYWRPFSERLMERFETDDKELE